MVLMTADIAVLVIVRESVVVVTIIIVVVLHWIHPHYACHFRDIRVYDSVV